MTDVTTIQKQIAEWQLQHDIPINSRSCAIIIKMSRNDI